VYLLDGHAGRNFHIHAHRLCRLSVSAQDGDAVASIAGGDHATQLVIACDRDRALPSAKQRCGSLRVDIRLCGARRRSDRTHRRLEQLHRPIRRRGAQRDKQYETCNEGPALHSHSLKWVLSTAPAG
jgi:hypothetical protein